MWKDKTDLIVFMAQRSLMIQSKKQFSYSLKYSSVKQIQISSFSNFTNFFMYVLHSLSTAIFICMLLTLNKLKLVKLESCSHIKMLYKEIMT